MRQALEFLRIRLRLRGFRFIDDEDGSIGSRSNEAAHERGSAGGERLFDIEHCDRLAVGRRTALDDSLAIREDNAIGQNERRTSEWTLLKRRLPFHLSGGRESDELFIGSGNEYAVANWKWARFNRRRQVGLANGFHRGNFKAEQICAAGDGEDGVADDHERRFDR